MLKIFEPSVHTNLQVSVVLHSNLHSINILCFSFDTFIDLRLSALTNFLAKSEKFPKIFSDGNIFKCAHRLERLKLLTCFTSSSDLSGFLGWAISLPWFLACFFILQHTYFLNVESDFISVCPNSFFLWIHNILFRK